jgi:hypothetical protein
MAELISVDPNHGGMAGGTPVQLSGSGFTGATDVLFADLEAQFSVDGDDVISCVAPARTDFGAVRIAVRVADGEAALEDGFTYDLPGMPQIAAITLTSGNVSGGDTMQIQGSGFTGTDDVRFDGAHAEFSVDSDVVISCTTPEAPHTGPVDIRVSANGQEGVLPAAFTYVE